MTCSFQFNRSDIYFFNINFSNLLFIKIGDANDLDTSSDMEFVIEDAKNVDVGKNFLLLDV